MTDKKKTKKSGFDAPVIGKSYPKNTRIVQNPDGTVSLVTNRKPRSKKK